MSLDTTSDKLIVALDYSNAQAARELVDQLDSCVSFYKVGLELLFAGGLELAVDLKEQHKRVFLDLKFLDIANTIEKAVLAASCLGVDFLTIHGHDSQTIKAAVRGRADSATKILAVTVLTSLAEADLTEQGISRSPADLALHRARLAYEAGADGVISSGQEAAAIRAATGPDFLIVTPGIRLPDDDAGDQKRIMSPQEAMAAGANHIVVGRPITAAADPAVAAEMFQKALAQG